jgi:cytochrome c553
MQVHLAGRTLIVATALALISPPVLAEGDPARGKTLAYTCMGCHGIEHYKNAYPKYSVPKLGGQSATYIAAALANYQAGARWHPTMTGLASSLSEQDRADLGAYFSSFASVKPAAKPIGTAPPAAAACAACHGADGVGTLPENPTLAGQYADYLAQALNDYRRGKRKNPIMGTFAAQLTQEDIAAITAYFSKQTGLVSPKLD